MAKKKNGSRKTYSPAEVEKALQLIKEGSTMPQVSAVIGCSVASLQQWKKGNYPGAGKKNGTMKSAPAAGPVAVAAVDPVESLKKMDEFIRSYWLRNNRAKAVLAMPHPMNVEVMFHINDALGFAWDQLKK